MQLLNDNQETRNDLLEDFHDDTKTKLSSNSSQYREENWNQEGNGSALWPAM